MCPRPAAAGAPRGARRAAWPGWWGGRRGVPGEGRAQRRAQRPQVGGRPLGAALDALGRHVVRRTDQHADHGERGGVLDRGDTEVGEHDPAAATGPGGRFDQYVAGLDVTVQHPGGVHLAQRGGQGEGDPGGLGDGHRAGAGEDLLQRAAADQFHDDPQPAVLLRHVVDPHHVGVVDPGRGTRLPQGPLVPDPGVLLPRPSSRISLTATCRCSISSTARHTRPMPPWPIDSPSR